MTLPMSKRIARKTKLSEGLLVFAFTTPKIDGPTNPPKLPIELITAIEIAADEGVRNKVGTAQNGDLNEYKPAKAIQITIKANTLL